MHKLHQLIRQVNTTHKGLGPLIAMNILSAKAKKTILNVAPSGCGKSKVTDSVSLALGERGKKFTSLTLAGMVKLKDEFNNFDGHVVIDDLGEEKSIWSRVSTITVLANVVYTHYIDKVTRDERIQINDFNGSVGMNIQPVIMNSLVQSDDWVAVVRDKVIRYYHLMRPVHPQRDNPRVNIEWGAPLHEIKMSKHRGKLWYQLVAIGLTQWSHGRVLEHLPDLLRACAALDGRTVVKRIDYNILIKLLQPLQLERYIITSYGFEQGRVFDNNLYCILVELASFGEPTLNTICEDYKVSPETARRLVDTVPDWVFVKTDSPTKVCATPRAKELLDICGVYQQW